MSTPSEQPNEQPDDLCPRPTRLPESPTRPAAPAIHLTSVWECDTAEQAAALLAREAPGYVYQRDGNPNADGLAQKIGQLHRAEHTIVLNSGMSALAAVMLVTMQAGDHVIISSRLYGHTMTLLCKEAGRLGIESDIVDTADPSAVAAACRDNTKLVIVETISNPTLRVADIQALAQREAHQHGAELMVDNTFATPFVCRPLEYGADWVIESLSKMMNGHSDLTLGSVSGRYTSERLIEVASSWGMTASPFDSWLATRGLATMHLRMERACNNTMLLAERLQKHSAVTEVLYPGLECHPDHALARAEFARDEEGRLRGYGSIVTFSLKGGEAEVARFIRHTPHLPFFPSLGDVSTSMSHPVSTSHRGLTPAQLDQLGISSGTIRLSVGCELPESLWKTLDQGLKQAVQA